MQRVGVLTGGGDCPGLNAVIRGLVVRLARERVEVLGIAEGWRGMVKKEVIPLDLSRVGSIIPVGGTILGSSRTNPYKKREDVERAISTYRTLLLDALVAIGGDDTLSVAERLGREEKLNLVGVPKTVDNDLSFTDYTFGFDTAVNVAMECIDRLSTTAESHRRVLVIECMGRHAGWIAGYAGVAAGADVILVPEKPMGVEEVCTLLKRSRERGKLYNLVVVAEGARLEGQEITRTGKTDEFGHVPLGGVAEVLAEAIEKLTGYETRHVVLGHIQRGGSPTAFDRILGTRYGVKAAEMVLSGEFGKMAALRGNEIVAVSLSEAVNKTRYLNPEFYQMAEVFFG